MAWAHSKFISCSYSKWVLEQYSSTDHNSGTQASPALLSPIHGFQDEHFISWKGENHVGAPHGRLSQARPRNGENQFCSHSTCQNSCLRRPGNQKGTQETQSLAGNLLFFFFLICTTLTRFIHILHNFSLQLLSSNNCTLQKGEPRLCQLLSYLFLVISIMFLFLFLHLFLFFI